MEARLRAVFILRQRIKDALDRSLSTPTPFLPQIKKLKLELLKCDVLIEEIQEIDNIKIKEYL